MRIQGKNLKIVISVAAILAIALIGWRLFVNAQFRIVDVLPRETLPTSSDTIVIDFSKKLKNIDEQPENFLSFEPAIATKLDVNDRTLTILLLEQTTDNTTLDIHIQGITADDGDQLHTTLNYTVEYVRYNELPQEEKDKQAASVVRPQGRHPLISKLPYDALSFAITYEATVDFGSAADWRDEKNNLAIYINTYALQLGASAEEYLARTNVLRTQALDWIRESGVDPENDITIIFTPSDDEILTGTNPDSTGDGIPPTGDVF